MMIMQILAAITPHCPQATCSLNIPYMSSDYVGRLANLPGIGLRFHNSLILQANKNIFNLFAIFFRFSLLFATIMLYLQHFSLPR